MSAVAIGGAATAVAVGALRHRLVLEAPLEVADGAGGVTRSFVVAANLWAAVEPLGTAPLDEAGRPAERARLRVVTRRRGDLAAGSRLVWGARRFEVRAVAELDALGRFMAADCEELGR